MGILRAFAPALTDNHVGVVSDRGRPLSHEFEDLNRGSIKDRAPVRPSPAQDPSFLAQLRDLDQGLFDDDGNPSGIVARPPLTAVLMAAYERQSQRPMPAGPINLREPGRRTQPIISWTAAFVLLAMLVGAGSAALTFHERLSQFVVQREVPAQSIP